MSKDMIPHSDRIAVNAQGHSHAFAWTRMLVICLIAIGHISTLPLGPLAPEALMMFGYNPSWLGVNTLFFMAGYMALRSLASGASPLKLLTSRLGRNFPTLLIYVAIAIFFIFPVFGINPIDINSLPLHLSIYAFDVISLSDPGRMLKGVFDDANYECVIQGAIWTFRWGAIAYIGTAIGWKFGLLKSKKMLYCLTAAAMLLYIIVHALEVRQGVGFPAAIGTALRLGWPFLAGMSLFSAQNNIVRHWVVAAILLIITSALFALLPWTAFIETFATLTWCYIAFMLFTSPIELPKLTQKMPDISLGIYMFHWPVAQIMLLLVPSALSIKLFLIAFPVTLALSYSVFWIDKRIRGSIIKAINAKQDRITAESKAP